MTRYTVLSVGELDRIPVSHGLEWRPIRRRLGIRAFGMNAYTAEKVGDCVVEEHKEGSGHEEVYVVLAGRATFTLGDEEQDAPAGTLVVIRDSSVLRHAVAAEEGTTVLAVGGKPGVHETSAWEYSFAAYGYLKEGRRERGLEVIREGLAERGGDDPRLLYDLACFESLAGDRDEALSNLLRAVEIDDRYREYAATDTDFQAIRDDPRFPR